MSIKKKTVAQQLSQDVADVQKSLDVLVGELAIAQDRIIDALQRLNGLEECIRGSENRIIARINTLAGANVAPPNTEKTPSPEEQQAVLENRLIDAIKMHRNRTGSMLHESKDIICGWRDAENALRLAKAKAEGSPDQPAQDLTDKDTTHLTAHEQWFINKAQQEAIGTSARFEFKINAIRAVRQRTGAGLREAKDLVESIGRF